MGNHERLRENLFAAELAVILAVCSQLTIPLPVVPLTGQTLAVGLLASIVSFRLANKTLILYMLLGAVGLPVFASAGAGIGVLFGPLGGFILGFFIQSWIILALRRRPTVFYLTLGNIVGAAAQLLVGTVWLKFYSQLSWPAALTAGLMPFIIPGIIKAVLATAVAKTILSYARLPFQIR